MSKIIDESRFICGYYEKMVLYGEACILPYKWEPAAYISPKGSDKILNQSSVFFHGTGKMIYETVYCIVFLCKEKYALV